ncbi:MAG: DEAD/DEAH box helicase [Saprospiraceae bacterium]
MTEKKNTQFNNHLKKALKSLKIETLNEMQLATLEAADSDRDIVLRSPTGTGKTLAFLLPILQQLQVGNREVQAVILAPTRELALQIDSVVRSMKIPFKVNCCYGGHPVRIEKRNLSQPPAILIATPGRLADHIHRQHISLKSAKFLVLDEFDKSLEIGFQDDMVDIIKAMPAIKKRILTSATNRIEIPRFAEVYKPIKLNFEKPKTEEKKLTIQVVNSPEKDKLNTLYQLICNVESEAMLVFCNYRETVDRVSDFLASKDVYHNIFHGGLEQIDREKTLSRFRNGSYNILVTTDLAARGLDIPSIKYVVHYHLANRAEDFTHRNGRTARMHADGTVLLLMHEEEYLPAYLTEDPTAFTLTEMPAPPAPKWQTLWIGKGKKDKINKIDIVGFLSKKGLLKKDEIGLIEVKDFYSFTAIKRTKMNQLLTRIQKEKIKGKKARMGAAK